MNRIASLAPSSPPPLRSPIGEHVGIGFERDAPAFINAKRKTHLWHRGVRALDDGATPSGYVSLDAWTSFGGEGSHMPASTNRRSVSSPPR